MRLEIVSPRVVGELAAHLYDQTGPLACLVKARLGLGVDQGEARLPRVVASQSSAHQALDSVSEAQRLLESEATDLSAPLDAELGWRDLRGSAELKAASLDLAQGPAALRAEALFEAPSVEGPRGVGGEQRVSSGLVAPPQVMTSSEEM